MARHATRWWRLAAVLLVTLAGTVALGLVEPSAAPQDDAKGKTEKSDGAGGKKKGGLRLPNRSTKKKNAEQADPLAKAGRREPGKGKAAAKGAVAQPQPGAAGAAAGPQEPVWPFHYTVKLGGVGRSAINVAYYPAKETFRAPVLMLLHESGAGHSGKDFGEAIDELKGKSVAGHFQELGYALLVVDLRGHGGNERRALTGNDWVEMVSDLQTAYTFLVDRHNRGELNLGKLGVIAVGDAANLAVAWAASTGGAVSSEGRISDLGALVLVSPTPSVDRLTLATMLPRIAARFPILALSGDRDEASIQAVRDNQRVIERHRLSRVSYFDTSLHGNRLLSFFPKVVSGVEQFLDDPVRFRSLDWEPRYLLEPVGYDQVELVADSGFAAAGAAAANPAAAKAQGKAGVPKAPAKKN